MSCLQFFTSFPLLQTDLFKKAAPTKNMDADRRTTHFSAPMLNQKIVSPLPDFYFTTLQWQGPMV